MSNCMFKKLNEAAELYCKLNFSQCTSWPTFYVGQMNNLHSEIKNARGIPLYCRGKFRKVFFLLLFLPSTRWPWKISDLKVSWKNLCKKCNIILLQTFPLKIPIDMLLLKLKNENIERICYLLDSGQCDTSLQVTCDLSPPPPLPPSPFGSANRFLAGAMYCEIYSQNLGQNRNYFWRITGPCLQKICIAMHICP